LTDRITLDIASAELPMADVFLPMMKSAALISAGQLGLFQALAEGPLEVATLAARLGCAESGVTRLADLLVSVGYLMREGPCLANAPQAARWFTAQGEVDYTAGLLWSGEAWGLMATLSDCVREGGPRVSLWERMESNPAWGPIFSRYMKAFAHHLGPDLLRHVPLSAGARRLLDLGGSHGLHAMAFCDRYPALEAVIVDQASALADTPQALRDAGMAGRIRTVAGDLRDADWGGDYDVVLFLSVMHNQSAEDNRRSVHRIAKALRPGGVLVIHEYPADAPLSAYDAAFRVTLLTETGTGTHTASALMGWLAAAGFGTPRRVNLDPLEKGTLFIASR
jgi:SAM-dependent methyltransferase